MTTARPAVRNPLLAILPLAVWFGVLAGFAEASLLAAARFVLGRYTHLGPHVAWMAPVAYTAAFCLLGFALFGAGRVWSRLDPVRSATLLFGLLAILGPLLLFTRLHPLAALALASGAAVQGSAVLARRRDAWLRLVRRTAPALATLVVLAAAGVRGWSLLSERRADGALPASPAGAPNVLVIILDTVRSLNLRLYGHARPTSPRLEELARRGVVFERAVAPASWTLPSHASMFTGRWPSELTADWVVGLDARFPTLAERLAARGYRTAGFVANSYYLARESGIQRGFVHYEDFRISLGLFVMATSLGRWLSYNRHVRAAIGYYELLDRKTADHVNSGFLAWLDSHRARPFFAFLNYIDAHEPYLPPAPFAARYGPRRPGYNPLLWVERRPDPDELRDLELAYDEAITYLDDRLGRLFDELGRRGLLDSTLVVVTADHGEEFGEHGLISHGYSLYLPSLGVPLVIALPGRVPAGRRVAQWVSLRDLPATVLHLAGGADPLIPGRSLCRFWADSAAISDTLYAEARFASGLPRDFPVSQGGVRSLLAGDLQYLATGTRREELYDLAADPAQRRNLAPGDSARGWLERLRATLERWPAQPR